ncbi:tRNA (guanosine(37)-N1)-methyltransferase TrmD [Helicobacter himalayensis]|uniref:tRNA (guanosine(37)-N1)-methyltransferase TrmD n=1 Tax=Helicobacter himalayensis TaxID=1591088 RepID=UPI003D6F5D03
MKFSFLSLFPQLIAPYFTDSILKRACEKGIIKFECINLRDFTSPPHFKADFAPISGGAGQVLHLEMLALALQNFRDSHVIFLSPCGKPFNQNDSLRLSKKGHISFVCGRYEGFDERAIELFADEVFSIGDFILTGGELGALSLADSIARQVEGVLGNKDSLKGESFESYLLEAPNFAKSSPKVEKILQDSQKLQVPSEYSKGNHSKIASLKTNLATAKTKYFRPDLYITLKAQSTAYKPKSAQE